MNEAEVIDYMKRLIDDEYGGLQSRFAARHGISAAYVNDVLQGRRQLGYKMLEAAKVERVIMYRKIS